THSLTHPHYTAVRIFACIAGGSMAILERTRRRSCWGARSAAPFWSASATCRRRPTAPPTSPKTTSSSICTRLPSIAVLLVQQHGPDVIVLLCVCRYIQAEGISNQGTIAQEQKGTVL